MSRTTMTRADRIGLVRPALDAHTLGMAGVESILKSCGLVAIRADRPVAEAAGDPDDPAHADILAGWIRDHRLTALGFSYRLDPGTGSALFERLVQALARRRLLAEQDGPIRALYFAGLPETCQRVRQRVPGVAGLFQGDESTAEILECFGLPAGLLPAGLAADLRYDEDRLAFGRDLVKKGDYADVPPPPAGGYPEFGTRQDSLVARLSHARLAGRLPLVRAHVGPYLPDRAEAVRLFLEWTRRLAAAGHLDILSIGTSQLTQSHFGRDWGDRPNGGGVPINSAAEFTAVREAARPMLVRTYAGTDRIPELARLHEQALNIAWHALSLWWFSRIDERGPLSVRDNLIQHFQALEYVAASGKPFEANVAHHFAFRGADDVSCIVAAVLAARAARATGVRHFVLQNMLNTPRRTWGIQDLAKSRALLALVRELQSREFAVVLQPRGGLDYFSPDADKARAQLAAVTALMDDIEPADSSSPPVIHVVSHSEASRLADPDIVDESIQITRHALAAHRQLRHDGQVPDMSAHPEVRAREQALLADARAVLAAIDRAMPDACTPGGLYRVFASGYLPVPDLWSCRDEFTRAVAWRTAFVRGGVCLVDDDGKTIGVDERLARVRSFASADGVPAPGWVEGMPGKSQQPTSAADDDSDRKER